MTFPALQTESKMPKASIQNPEGTHYSISFEVSENWKSY